jgi:ribonuclease HI
MAKAKFYAVRKGLNPGIYTTWEETAAQVQGFKGAQYRGFATHKEAMAYLRGESIAYVQSSLLAPEPEPPAQPAPRDASGLKQVIVYTDGGCISNPGPGGYGIVMIYNGQRREMSGGFRRTTNNRMELTACIVALETLKESVQATIYSDSSYLVNAMTAGWALRWRQMGWQRKAGPVPNADLWIRLLDLAARHDLRFEWVQGHAGNPENERCDQLATAAMLRPDLPPDEGYENAP